MIETSPRTGQSVLAPGVFTFLGAASTAVASIIPGPKMTAGGGANTAGISGTTPLHFHEARVYTIPGVIENSCGACPSGDDDDDFQVNYISDSDPLWRLSQPHLSLENPINGLGPMGVWGKLHPRVGFLAHGSGHVAAAAAAIRAAWIAYDPPGLLAIPPDPRLAAVTNQSDVEPVCWQLGYPKQFKTLHNECYPPGVHPEYWDYGLQTLDSSMLHFLYKRKTC